MKADPGPERGSSGGGLVGWRVIGNWGKGQWDREWLELEEERGFGGRRGPGGGERIDGVNID